MVSMSVVAANKRHDESWCCFRAFINSFDLSDRCGELFKLGFHKSTQFAIAASLCRIFTLR
jgi:hypothetical protein